MTPERIQQLLNQHRDDLLKNTIPFWLNNNTDTKNGGFFNYLDQKGNIYHTDKAVWILGRFTWLMSLLYNNVEKRPEWLNAAQSGIDFISKHGFDTDGRMFFTVTADGRPVQKRRYVFSETFATIAFSEFAIASGSQQALDKANEIYQRLLCYYNNPNLLPPKFFPQTVAGKSHAMAMILIATSQQIRKTAQNPLYDQTIDQCLDEIFNHFMHDDVKALLETVGPQGQRIDSPDGRCINPGHAIETAWFILEEGRQRNDQNIIKKACQILDWSLDWGWDKQYGGIYYFRDAENKPCTQYEFDMKLWWPHNEALYATLLAFHITGDAKYEKWYETLHCYAYSHFPDTEHGEWFKYLHRDGTVSHTLKGNGWAGPFHLPRMQYNCWKLLEEMNKKST